MPVKQARPRISFPSGWHGRVKSAVLHTISLAHFSIVHARGMAAGVLVHRIFTLNFDIDWTTNYQ